MTIKTCPKCEEDLSVEKFYASKVTKDGMYYMCKECQSIRNKTLYRANKDKIKKRVMAYRQTDRGREVKRRSDQKRRKKHREYQRVWEYKKYHSDPHFKIKACMSMRLRDALRRHSFKKNGASLFDLLPYSLEELMQHLEKQFEPGMTWSNHGEWHIDHIKADVRFKYSSVHDEEFRRCWSLENLQPLWPEDNLRKWAH